MGKRAASSRSTRGVSKAKRPASSSSSNPKTTKFRSQYNNLAVIAKGGPSKKSQNKEAMKKLAKEALERKNLLDGLDTINLIQPDEPTSESTAKRKKGQSNDATSVGSAGTRFTTASFASVWSNCTNTSLNEFFHVWNPNLETHKDALAVIAGLSQTMSSSGKEQSDLEFASTLFKILANPNTSSQVLTGSLLALTFVMRKLPSSVIVDNFDSFYPVLRDLMEKYHTARKKTLIKCLLRCFSCISKAHPDGKNAIEKTLKKKINLAIRQYKVQDKIQL